MIYIIAGEASGDFLGSRLIAALRSATKGQDIRPLSKLAYNEEMQGAYVAQNRNVHEVREDSSNGETQQLPLEVEFGEGSIAGVGGDLMQAEGLQSLFPMADIALMGLTEVIPHLPKLLKRINQTADDIIMKKPKVLVTIDSPGFCNRVIKKVKRALPEIKAVHYVAPSVWAWKPGRALKLAKAVDHLLTLFPFENKYFTCHGLPTTFVGHSIIEHDLRPDPNFMARHKIDEKSTLICMLPGSRRGEIKNILPEMITALSNLKKDIPNLHVVAPSLPEFAQKISEQLSNAHIPHTVTTGAGERYAAMFASKAAIATSGTVNLEAAVAGLPIVACYKGATISYLIVKSLIKIKHVCITNILADQCNLKEEYRITELIQSGCNAKNIQTELLKIIRAPEDQTKMLAKIPGLLSNKENIPPSQKAAQVILGLYCGC